ncbi:Gfo/Idh/MocA family oxidoreductase [Rhodonellum sp.]|uniref:Gfo/Idh/MocA family oxidoreductase n=1 Tax=Rhodonellum sp. TaxID=2231180 RepID=UPI00271D3513|nr:Gfo/Idh/MocA family oxidoreductase [Rhodonellum sp.]MDO9551471.1 Gfo/Idh/MocA family oxidoreductase [Rhodonellum sp.]
MEIGYASKLYAGIPGPTPIQDEILLESVHYLAVRPNGNNGLVYEQGKSGAQKILNYAKVYRPIDLVRKVLSRQKIERIRNDKWLVCGIGKDVNNAYHCFVHPSAQYFQSQLAVPACWTKRVEHKGDEQLWGQLPTGKESIDLLEEIAEMMPPISGAKYSEDLVDLNPIIGFLAELRKGMSPVSTVFPDREEIAPTDSQPSNGQIGAVLFGYGNYARTITLPFLKPFVHLHKIHEIDSSLLIEAGGLPKSTNPKADKEDAKYPVWLIAGFHHTHAGLAIDALKAGAIPVIEKPIATNLEDFEAFKKTATETGSPFFQCFQKRYQVFNSYTFEDLEVTKGDPIHYKATVFEIPLHKQHWYNWPVSGSRIISNGCHWIDQFLFLNNYVPFTKFETKRLNDQELLLLIELENGANAVITLSDIGPNRIGMREYVELSVPDRRVTIIDSMKYSSESSVKTIRTKNTDKLHYLRLMYQEIGYKIKMGEQGDSIQSLLSTELAIKMEEQFQSL